MTTTTLAPTHRTQTARLTVTRVVRSEWIKLNSLRSTFWSYVILVAVTIGLAGLFVLTIDTAALTAAQEFDAVITAATIGVFFGQLIVAVLGVLVITGEYTTGQIRSSLTAVPSRLPVLGAKALVLFVSTFLVGIVSTVLGYATAAVIVTALGGEGSLLVTDAIIPVIDSALYLAIIAVFALGLGTIIRSTAGGVSAALGVILLVPLVFGLIPVEWMTEAQPYLLTNAALQIFTDSPGTLPVEQQLLVTAIWVGVSLGLGALLLKRRDA